MTAVRAADVHPAFQGMDLAEFRDKGAAYDVTSLMRHAKQDLTLDVEVAGKLSDLKRRATIKLSIVDAHSDTALSTAKEFDQATEIFDKHIDRTMRKIQRLFAPIRNLCNERANFYASQEKGEKQNLMMSKWTQIQDELLKDLSEGIEKHQLS